MMHKKLFPIDLSSIKRLIICDACGFSSPHYIARIEASNNLVVRLCIECMAEHLDRLIDNRHSHSVE